MPGGSYDWTGRATALDLGRLGLPLEWELSGTADAVLSVTGRAGDPRWTLESRARRPGALGHGGDSARLVLAGGPGSLQVRDFEYRLGAGSLRGELAFDGTREAWPDTLTGPGVRDWLATASAWRGRLSADGLPARPARPARPGGARAARAGWPACWSWRGGRARPSWACGPRRRRWGATACWWTA